MEAHMAKGSVMRAAAGEEALRTAWSASCVLFLFWVLGRTAPSRTVRTPQFGPKLGAPSQKPLALPFRCEFVIRIAWRQNV